MDGFWSSSWIFLALPAILCILCYAVSYWYWVRTTIPVQYVSYLDRFTFGHQYLVRLVFQESPTGHGSGCRVEAVMNYSAKHNWVTLYFPLNRIFLYHDQPASLVLLRSRLLLDDLMTVQLRLVCPPDCQGFIKANNTSKRSNSSSSSSPSPSRLEVLQASTLTVQNVDYANQLEVKKPLSTMRFHSSPTSTRLHVTVERKTAEMVWLREEYRYPLALEQVEPIEKNLLRASLVCPATSYLACQLVSLYLDVCMISNLQAQLFVDWYPSFSVIVMIECIMASIYLTVFVYLFALYAFVVVIQEQLLIIGSMGQSIFYRLLHSTLLLFAIFGSLAGAYTALCHTEQAIDSIATNPEFNPEASQQYWNTWRTAYFVSLVMFLLLQCLLIALDCSPCGLLSGHYSPRLDGQCRTCLYLYRCLPGIDPALTRSLLLVSSDGKGSSVTSAVPTSFNRFKS